MTPFRRAFDNLALVNEECVAVCALRVAVRLMFSYSHPHLVSKHDSSILASSPSGSWSRAHGEMVGEIRSRGAGECHTFRRRRSGSFAVLYSATP